MATKVRLGGVPEHFNTPIHWGIKNNIFKNAGIEIIWTDYSTGTGAMCKDLADDVLDMAIVLTEGAIAAISKNTPVKLIQWYVKSPLNWGIHTDINSKINSLEYSSQYKYAISRFGSGSHLMAHVDNARRNLTLQDDQFVVVNNIAGAEAALQSGTADFFMWEKFTTKPWVDKKIFKRIGECPTPWPCFVLVASEKNITVNQDAVRKTANAILASVNDFLSKANHIEEITNLYHLEKSDIAEWLKSVEWATENHIDQEIIEEVIDALDELKQLESEISPAQCIAAI